MTQGTRHRGSIIHDEMPAVFAVMLYHRSLTMVSVHKILGRVSGLRQQRFLQKECSLAQLFGGEGDSI